MDTQFSLTREGGSRMVQPKTEQGLVIGNRIPKDFFISQGHGESDLTDHAGSYHLALKAAGVECYNHMTYSSILPAIAREVPKPQTYEHGSVLETIAAVKTVDRFNEAHIHDPRVTAGIIYAWLHHQQTGQKHGGLVCEYSGNESVGGAEQILQASLREIYGNGFSERYRLTEPKMVIESFTPQKRYGTALVIMGFTSYMVPVIEANLEK